MSDNPLISPLRLCLGTAQLGSDYGVANRLGKPADAACAALLSRAVERGLVRWDTAPTYGDAEQRIGQFLARCPQRDRVQIVSKLPAPPVGLTPSALLGWVSDQAEASLRMLGVDRLAGWLIHSPEALVTYGPALTDAMVAQVERGLVAELGASVYDVSEGRAALGQKMIGALQIPLNLLDSRFVQAKVLDHCLTHGVTVYARSAFLQGVLSMDLAALPSHLERLRVPLAELAELLGEHHLTPMEVALPYVLSYPAVDFAVIGVDSVEQLDDNLTMLDHLFPLGLCERLQSLFANLDAEVLEPRRWPASSR